MMFIHRQNIIRASEVEKLWQMWLASYSLRPCVSNLSIHHTRTCYTFRVNCKSYEKMANASLGFCGFESTNHISNNRENEGNKDKPREIQREGWTESWRRWDDEPAKRYSSCLYTLLWTRERSLKHGSRRRYIQRYTDKPTWIEGVAGFGFVRLAHFTISKISVFVWLSPLGLLRISYNYRIKYLVSERERVSWYIFETF